MLIESERICIKYIAVLNEFFLLVCYDPVSCAIVIGVGLSVVSKLSPCWLHDSGALLFCGDSPFSDSKTWPFTSDFNLTA